MHDVVQGVNIDKRHNLCGLCLLLETAYYINYWGNLSLMTSRSVMSGLRASGEVYLFGYFVGEDGHCAGLCADIGRCFDSLLVGFGY